MKKMTIQAHGQTCTFIQMKGESQSEFVSRARYDAGVRFGDDYLSWEIENHDGKDLSPVTNRLGHKRRHEPYSVHGYAGLFVLNEDLTVSKRA